MCLPRSLDEHGSCAGGTESIEVMFKPLGARLSAEGFAFMVSCLVGPLGGWIYILTRSQPSTPAAASTTD